jgi:arylsulfatase A-like enzyme
MPNKTSTPNILLIMSDEFRYPRYFKTPDELGKMSNDDLIKEAIKYVLAFKEFPDEIKNNVAVLSDINKFFPGLIALRENAVVLCNHTIAATACVPSRAVLFTGHYGNETGVTQTDGIFKSGEDENFPWLDKDGIPTTGDWFCAAHYETHYFGKCHFALSNNDKLTAFGFDNWNNSSPEPHGSNPANLGIYRDPGFASLVTDFIDQKANGGSVDKPWFAVASFTNPHDITTYPALLRKILPDNAEGASATVPAEPLNIPEKGVSSKKQSEVNNSKPKTEKNIDTKLSVSLNPFGFPQDNADLPDSWNEKLRDNNKPDCQYDFSLKMGIAAAASASDNLVTTKNSPDLVGLPFQLTTNNPEKWSKAYLQYYTYLHTVLDPHINSILQKLEATEMDKNTIIVFAPDHGDYGAAHGMLIEKWHTAYQEAIQVPVVVKLPGSGSYKSIDNLTSHIDILPTLLGLVGVNINDLEVTVPNYKSLDKEEVFEGDKLIGADLSNLIMGIDSDIRYKDGTVRNEILFVTADKITEPLALENKNGWPGNYKVFNDAIDYFKNDGPLNYGGTGKNKTQNWTDWTQYLKVTEAPNGRSVCSPCSIQCVRQGDWKLVRYYEDSKSEAGNQWELYNLKDDPNEMKNLLVYNATTFPTVCDPSGEHAGQYESKAGTLRTLLYQLVLKYKAADAVPV